MKSTKHVFLQINTDNIVAICNEKEKNSQPIEITEKEVLSNSFICSRGSMAMGDPVKDFIVETDIETDVSFTILPQILYSNHILYFKQFIYKNDIDLRIIPKIDGERQLVSFIVEVESEGPEKIPFSLEIVLKYQNLNGDWKSIDMCVDPVLQVKQS
jgi:hypothetical protein